MKTEQYSAANIYHSNTHDDIIACIDPIYQSDTCHDIGYGVYSFLDNSVNKYPEFDS